MPFETRPPFVNSVTVEVVDSTGIISLDLEVSTVGQLKDKLSLRGYDTSKMELSTPNGPLTNMDCLPLPDGPVTADLRGLNNDSGFFHNPAAYSSAEEIIPPKMKRSERRHFHKNFKQQTLFEISEKLSEIHTSINELKPLVRTGKDEDVPSGFSDMPEYGSVQPSLIQPSLKTSFMAAFPSASRRDVIRRELGLEKIQEVYTAILELEDDPTDALGISLEKMMADREASHDIGPAFAYPY